MCFHIGKNRGLTISLHCTILRTVCVVWVLSHVTEQLCSWQQQSPAVGEAHSSFLKATLLSAKSRKLWPLQCEGENCALQRQKGVLTRVGFPCSVLGFHKQTNPQVALCPRRHVVCEVLWERSESPLSVVCLKSLLTFPLLLQSQLGLDYLNRRDEVFSIMTD